MLTAIAALLLFAVVRTVPELLLPYGNLILTVYFAYNPYSYNTIFYPGFALFICSLMGTHAYVTVRCFQDPDSYRAAQMLFTLVHSAKNYMFLTTPFLLMLSLSLFISNIALIRHEGRRFVNVLGILLSVMVLAGEVLVALLDVWSSFSGLGFKTQFPLVKLRDPPAEA